jgi:ribonucleotide reductase alpha subunit
MSFSKPVNPPNSVELKHNDDGTDNAKYIDLLDEDKSIAGQKFACLSFISPEHILKQKDMFLFEEFIKNWDFSKSMEKFSQFLNFVSFKYHLDFDKLTKDFQEFTKDEKDKLIATRIEDDYKNFLDEHEDRLTVEFGETHNFQTSIRGIKVRGVFPTQQEAELRCKMLRQNDPNHDVYVGPIGVWVPFHPEAYKTGRVEYMEETLNELMSEKKKNEEKAKDEFDARVKETKEKAMEENKQKALESGNKLTQTINKEGNLVSVANMNTQDGGETTTIEDVRKELFEGDNIVTNDKTDHGLSKLNGVSNSDITINLSSIN